VHGQRIRESLQFRPPDCGVFVAGTTHGVDERVRRDRPRGTSATARRTGRSHRSDLRLNGSRIRSHSEHLPHRQRQYAQSDRSDDDRVSNADGKAPAHIHFNFQRPMQKRKGIKKEKHLRFSRQMRTIPQMREPLYILNQFFPLAATRAGRKACKEFGIEPFVDSSCRREPDLESEYPSISSACRREKFAPRLGEGDIIVYSTKCLLRDGIKARRMVAVLRVIRSFRPSAKVTGKKVHEEAANWYQVKSLPFPSNCFLDGNPPKSMEETDGGGGWRNVQEWDNFYVSDRIQPYGHFHICEKIFCDLSHPIPFTDEDLERWFGRVVGLRNPGNLPLVDFVKMLTWIMKSVSEKKEKKRLARLLTSLS
jgi:hypothetical protein